VFPSENRNVSTEKIGLDNVIQMYYTITAEHRELAVTCKPRRVQTEGNMARKTYYGYWGANNGSGNREPVKFTNKKEAIKTMRSIAKGNVFAGNTGWWRVCNHAGACEYQDCGTTGTVRG